MDTQAYYFNCSIIMTARGTRLFRYKRILLTKGVRRQCETIVNTTRLNIFQQLTTTIDP